MVQVFGGGEQFLGLEHAVAVADPPSFRSAGQPEPAPDSQVLPVLEGVPDACDSRRPVRLTPQPLPGETTPRSSDRSPDPREAATWDS
jgi:hypothetical protein